MMSRSQNITRHRWLLLSLSLVIGVFLTALLGPSASSRTAMAATMADASAISAPIAAPDGNDRSGEDRLAYDSASDDVLWDTHTIVPLVDAPSTRPAAPIRLAGRTQRLPIQAPPTPPFEPPRV